MLPSAQYALSEEVLEFQAVWVEHFHYSILRWKQADVLVDERSLGRSRPEDNDASLRRFLHHGHLEICLFLFNLLAEHVTDNLGEGDLVICLQPAVKGLTQSLYDGLFLIFERFPDDAEVEDEELHGPEAEVVLRPEAELDRKVLEHYADLVSVDGRGGNAQTVEHHLEDLLVVWNVD